jgi:hypothetical protein
VRQVWRRRHLRRFVVLDVHGQIRRSVYNYVSV